MRLDRGYRRNYRRERAFRSWVCKKFTWFACKPYALAEVKPEWKGKLKLPRIGEAKDHPGLNQNCITIEGVNDLEEFDRTVHALRHIGKDAKSVEKIFELIGALMTFCDLKFEDDEDHTKLSDTSEKMVDRIHCCLFS